MPKHKKRMTGILTIQFSMPDRELIDKAAEAAKMPAATWARIKLLAAAVRANKTITVKTEENPQP